MRTIANTFGFVLAFVSTATAYADQTQTDKLQIGRNTNSDKVIEFRIGLGTANPKIKWESASSQVKVANDGVNFTPISASSSNAAEISGNTTLTATQNYVANISTVAATWTLPSSSSVSGHVYHIYHDSDYPLIIAASGSDKVKYGYNTALGGDSSITITDRGVVIDVVSYGGTIYRVH